MHHLVIFIHITSIIIGTWAAVYSHLLYKTFKISLIRTFKYFIIFFNLNLVNDLFIKY